MIPKYQVVLSPEILSGLNWIFHQAAKVKNPSLYYFDEIDEYYDQMSELYINSKITAFSLITLGKEKFDMDLPLRISCDEELESFRCTVELAVDSPDVKDDLEKMKVITAVMEKFNQEFNKQNEVKQHG